MKEHDENILNKLSALLFNHEINEITIISLFGGSGVYCNGIMFAWVYENNLYLKGHADYLDIFVQQKMKRLEFHTGVTIKLLQYNQVTDFLWQNEKELIKIVKMVIEHTHQMQSLQLKEPRIKDLPNMTSSLERSLFKVGITNIDIFRQMGVFESYFKLKQANRNISTNVLYTLHSALIGKHVATLTSSQKCAIKAEYRLFIAVKK